MTNPPSISLDEIVEEVFLRATPERVWRALTDPDELVTWWGDPAAYVCTRWTLDLRVGGSWRAGGRNAGGGAFQVSGHFLEIDPERVLAYTWEPSWVAVPPTTVRIALTPGDGGTRVLWRHSGFAGYPRALADHRGGLPTVLAWLARYVDAPPSGHQP
ncbi:MAG TPA: SRPBCC domain-containing protein [Gemmatimonadales bacterium]|nr:SRPBCC domain-containing protein [Gemmatimonadales bacterium]